MQHSSSSLTHKHHPTIDNSYKDRNMSLVPAHGNYPLSTKQNGNMQSLQPGSSRFNEPMLSAAKGSASHNAGFYDKNRGKNKDLSAAKLKALIKPREVQIDDLPSDISNDEWGEI